MDVPANTLADRRADAERRLAELKEQRGAAALADEAFDDDLITAAEAEVGRLVDAADVAATRKPAEDRRALRALYDKHLVDFDVAADRRLAAVSRAEKAGRDLAAALGEALSATADGHAAAVAMHELVRPNSFMSPMVFGPIGAERLEGWLLAAFRSLVVAATGKRDFGNVDLMVDSSDPLPSVSWALLEKAAIAPSRKYFAAEAPPQDQGQVA